jgi:PRC-barrel domain
VTDVKAADANNDGAITHAEFLVACDKGLVNASASQASTGKVKLMTYKQSAYDPANNTIGEIQDVILSPDGRVAAVVLGVGGFLASNTIVQSQLGYQKRRAASAVLHWKNATEEDAVVLLRPSSVAPLRPLPVLRTRATIPTPFAPACMRSASVPAFRPNPIARPKSAEQAHVARAQPHRAHDLSPEDQPPYRHDNTTSSRGRRGPMWPAQGRKPGNAAACFTQFAICASSSSSPSWMSM